MSGIASASTQQRAASLLVSAGLILPSMLIYPGGEHVFWTPEALAARLLAPLALCLALLAQPAEGVTREPRLRPALWIFGAWALWLCLAAAVSARPDLGLATLLEWAAYPLMFAATWRVSASTAARQRLATLVLAGGALHSIYALAQLAGLDLFAWSTGFGGRPGGLLGNPNFLGGHLALLLPLGLAWALQPMLNTAGTALAWANVTLLCGALLATQTRGAWIGAGVGLAWLLLRLRALLPGLLTQRKQELRILLAVLGVALGSALFAKPQLATRLLDALLGRDVEVSRRVFLAGRTTRLALEHPGLGVGPGQFRIHFPSVQVSGIEPEALRQQDYIVTEHAHNDWLQMAAEGGWLAALLWLALLIWFFAQAHRAPPEAAGATDRALLAGGGGGLLALQLHGLANYPFLLWPTQMLAWGLAALCLRALWGAEPQPWRAARSWVLALGLAFAAFASWGGLRFMFVDHLWWIGKGEIELKRAQVGMTWLGKASALAPKEDRIWALGGDTLTKMGEYEASISADQRALSLNPYDSLTRLRLGRNLIILGRMAEAEAALAELGRYAPNMKELWHPLAQALFANQKYLGAAEAYNWAIFYGQDPANAYVNQAACYGLLNEPPKAMATLEKAQVLYPLNAKVQVNIAITALRMGAKARARSAYERALSLDPEQAELPMIRRALGR